MKKTLLLLTVICFAQFCAAQQREPAAVCTEKAFKVLRQLPKLAYECAEGLNDYDEKILKLPGRRAAIRGLVKELEGFTTAAWWQSSVDELNACQIHGGAGELTDDEKTQWRSGDYVFSLFGSHEARLALISDPCYQTGYGGLNAFLLYRNTDRVIVTQVLDGYYSRVDNSVSVGCAESKGQHIVEVATSNSMPPTLVSYFFTIDRSGHAVPIKIFREGKRLTNEIRSAMRLSDPKDLHLPNDATELNIIRNGKLAQSFSAYEASERGRIDANGGRMRRIVHRWNGTSYVRSLRQ